MQINKFLVSLSCAVMMLNLSGCVGYQLGSMLPDDIRTVCIPTFVNKTDEANIEIETTQAAIREFQKDGSLQVVSCEEADVILDVVLKVYDLEPISYGKDRETTAEEYRVWITASYVLRRRADDTVVSEAPGVRGQSTFEFTGDLSLMKRTALPATARDLAHEIVERVVEAWGPAGSGPRS
ncbi:MAG: LPS assembly lipoprotein LptE [Kiritimatiellia bacterium]